MPMTLLQLGKLYHFVLTTMSLTSEIILRLWFGQDEVMRQAVMDMLCEEAHPAFLYITPESFYSLHIYNLLKRMYDEGYIDRLVFDEVQVVLEVSTFLF